MGDLAPEQEKEEPRYEPRWKAWAYLATGLIAALICALVPYYEHETTYGVYWAVPVLLVFAGAAAYTFFHPLPTKAQQAAKAMEEMRAQAVVTARAPEQLKAQERRAEFMRRWYVRYAFAAAALALAYYFVQADPDKWEAWLFGGALAIFAAIKAWELAVVAVGLGAVIWLFSIEWKLSIPAAIILGACIIAYAISNKEN